MNNTKKGLVVACLVVMPAFALAGDDAAAPIALDKAWGAASAADDAGAMISDKLPPPRPLRPVISFFPVRHLTSPPLRGRI